MNGRQAKSDRLIVFVKAPRPGLVKTRLAATLGAEAAMRAHRELAARTLRQVAPAGPGELWFTPDDAGAEVADWLGPGWRARPQGQGDLGERMSRAFATAFGEGAHRVAIIGSDCPGLNDADVRDAWQALNASDLALGPACDGGYWLIAATRLHPELFTAMPWGSDQVLAQTLLRASSTGLRVHLLRELSDVDDEAGWRAYRAGQGLW